jgi:hypothetical protein
MASELKVQEATAKRSSMKSANKEGPSFKDAPPSPSKDEKKHKEHHHKDKEGKEAKADVISPEAKPKKDLPKEGKPKDSPTEGVKHASVKGVHLQGDEDEPEEAAASPSAPAVKYPAISPESIPADVIAKVKTWKVRQAAMHGGKVCSGSCALWLTCVVLQSRGRPRARLTPSSLRPLSRRRSTSSSPRV